MWRMLIPLIALLLFAFPVQAQECASVDSVIARVKAEDAGADIIAISGDAADQFGAGISEKVGQDLPRGATYVVVYNSTFPLAYVVMFENGCASQHGRFPAPFIQALLRGTAS